MICSGRAREDSGRGSTALILKITRDPEVAPLATFVAHVRCARNGRLEATITSRLVIVPTRPGKLRSIQVNNWRDRPCCFVPA
jgi:hypothetical protein